MAVTLTQPELSAALRLGETAEETAEATRLLSYSTTAVIKYAPSAPDVIHNEAVIRLAGYLFDAPTASAAGRYANALRFSGAAAILLPYRIHRAGLADAVDTAQDAVGTAGNPVTGVVVVDTTLTVSFADGTTLTYALPSGGDGGGGGDGTDQTARDAAAAAQASANAAQVTANDAQTTANDATTPAQARAEARTVVADFAEADNSDLIPARKVTAGAEGTFLAVEGVQIVGKDLGDITDTQARTDAAAALTRVGTLEDDAIVNLLFSSDGASLVEVRQDTDDNTSATIPDVLRPDTWAHRGSIEIIPSDRLPSGNAVDQQARDASTANTADIGAILLGERTITRLDDPESEPIANIHKRSILGEGFEADDETVDALYYRKRSLMSVFQVRFDDLSSRSQFATHRAFGWARTAVPFRYQVGGAILPAVPAGLQSLTFTIEIATNQRQYRLIAPDVAPFSPNTLTLQTLNDAGDVLAGVDVTRPSGKTNT